MADYVYVMPKTVIKRQKIRLGCKLPKWDFRHIELTKVRVSDPVSLVYRTTEPW